MEHSLLMMITTILFLYSCLTRWLTRHPNKLTNYIRNMDALEAVGGNPFMLDMQVSPDLMFTKKVNTQ